jgi:hypothetical protein
MNSSKFLGGFGLDKENKQFEIYFRKNQTKNNIIEF